KVKPAPAVETPISKTPTVKKAAKPAATILKPQGSAQAPRESTPKEFASTEEILTTQADVKSGKPWLAHYPKGVPAEIGPFEYQSLGDLMVESCRKFGSKPAFTCM